MANETWLELSDRVSDLAEELRALGHADVYEEDLADALAGVGLTLAVDTNGLVPAVYQELLKRKSAGSERCCDT